MFFCTVSILETCSIGCRGTWSLVALDDDLINNRSNCFSLGVYRLDLNIHSFLFFQQQIFLRKHWAQHLNLDLLIRINWFLVNFVKRELLDRYIRFQWFNLSIGLFANLYVLVKPFWQIQRVSKRTCLSIPIRWQLLFLRCRLMFYLG